MSGAPRRHLAASDLGEIREEVRAGMTRAASRMPSGLPSVDLEGQLIRPVVAYAVALQLGVVRDDRFWSGVLAVQLAHEASLVHDDIIDGAAERRGRPTLFSTAGAAGALAHGDHLLTASYRLACEAGSLELVSIFSRAVERTVAAEIEQGRTLGQTLDASACRRISEGKAGELLGFAMAIAPAVARVDTTRSFYRLGKGIGLLYQMLDDLLDYCPSADTGKPALGDHAQRRWTWPLAYLSDQPLELSGRAVVSALSRRGEQGTAPFERCLARVERTAETLLGRIALLLPEDRVLTALIAEWVERARSAVGGEMAPRSDGTAGRPDAVVSATLRLRLPTGATSGYFASSRTFRFAARLFPASEGECVARVYAYCRALDDLVDDSGSEPVARTGVLLDEWQSLSERAYLGSPSGIDLIDAPMADMAASGVPFHYASELVEGMRMDLRGTRYDTLLELRGYSYRVASVVGLWLTRLFGTHDAAVLDDAARLGQAMQLTNILRDVGEDWDRGRLYLPAELLARHGLDAAAIGEMRSGARAIGPEYRALLEHLIGVADRDYERAFAAIPRLPHFFRGPVAVAARLYQGIHGSIRGNGYDNLSRRAYTGGPLKTALAARALWDLRRLPQATLASQPESPGATGTHLAAPVWQ